MSYSTDPIEAGRAAGQLVLGLDFESHGGQWTPGDWTAVVYVDGKEDQTVQFNVRPPVINLLAMDNRNVHYLQ